MEISRVIYSDEKASYYPVYTPDIVFAKRETGDLKLQLLSPIPTDMPQKPRKSVFSELIKQGKWQPPAKDPRKFPLIVNVPGSGWSGTEGYSGIPKLAEIAKLGFVVASIAYRGTFEDDVRFPAAVQDTKEAIRFLRANAEMFHIDPDHVMLLGDSSGGHTAAMAALTGDEERFNIGGHLDQRTDVNACCIF